MLKKQNKIPLTVLFISVISICVQGKALTDESTACPQLCPLLLAPVCATNGDGYQEFGNKCVLQSANCHMKRSALKEFEEVDSDWCKTKFVEDLHSVVGNLDLNRPECMKACTFIYQPICVSNGKYRSTVASQCMLDMFNCGLATSDSNEPFRILSPGECPK